VTFGVMVTTENTARKIALVDDYARQGVTRGIVTCLGGDAKQAVIMEMVADGLLVQRHPEIKYGVYYFELTEAGWKWLADKRCFQ